MRIAVVGAGISGLGAAYALSRVHHVDVFEREATAGGHVNTVMHEGTPLDTGFIVLNELNYPLLNRLFRELGVRTQESEMSFSVSCAGCGLEYSGRRPFAQPGNLLSIRFGSLLWEIGRWLRTARASLDEADYDSYSLGRYLDERGYSERFRRHFLIPFTAALWSTAPGRALEFPAAHAIRFFENHGMLGFGRLRWQTVVGGAQTYVRAVLPLSGFVQTGLPVRSVRRDADKVVIRTDDDKTRTYDRVVIATHADQALALLEDPSDHERAILGAFPYTRNDAVLHTDSSRLPRANGARAAWNYRLAADEKPTVTYSLNRLQQLNTERDYLLTLNEDVAEEHELARFAYSHPLFTLDAIRAQERLGELSGRRGTEFAGAYQGNGFHEDGLASGIRAAASLGVSW
ncbi:MAG: FAD-dependent oxidoreductase [Actinobacteria bacterium]|nr:FAD-dependent oxidoreductase [Actinomycetota bacterium]